MKPISIPQVYTSVQRCMLVSVVIILSCISKTSGAFTVLRYSLISPLSETRALGNLPVIITPLKGYYLNGISHLSWKSLQETNSSHFEIERSVDGINFKQVGRTTAQGASDKEVEYSFCDIKVNAGLNYYRLKQVDKDGDAHYSNIEVLNVNIKGINITGIYPGPFTDKVNVTISSEIKTATNIDLFDNSGKLLSSRKEVLTRGVTNLILDNLDHLAKGLYIIKVQAGETIIVKKLIK